MEIDYEKGTYSCVNGGEYYAVLYGLDPFCYALPVWHEEFKRLWAGWSEEDYSRAYPWG